MNFKVSITIVSVLVLGGMFRDSTFSINIHDTYYLLSWFEISVVSVLAIGVYFTSKHLFKILSGVEN